MNECKIHPAPIVTPAGDWIGELGDIQVRGVSYEDARQKLNARIGELIRQLNMTALLGRGLTQ